MTDRVDAQSVIISVAAAANKGRAILMGTAMAVYIDRAGGSPFAVSLVLTAFFVGMMLFSPVFGAVADVTGRRRAVLLVTSVLATVAVVPLTVVDGVWLPLAFRTVFALFAAGFLPVMLTIVSERGGTEGRGRSVGLFNSAQATGFTAAQFFAGVLLGLVAQWALYAIVAAVSAVTVLAAVFVEDPTPTPDRRVSATELLAEVRARLFPAAADRDHLQQNGLQWLYVAVLLRNMTVLGISSVLPVYLLGQVGVSEFVMGVLLAINPAAQMAFMYLFGQVSDAVGRKPLVVAGIGASAAYALVMAAAVLPGTVLSRAAVAGAAMFVLAAGFSAETTGEFAFIGDVAPANRESELMGLYSTARGLGGALGPALVGLAATVTSFESAFVVASVLGFVATGVVGRALVESYPPVADSNATGGD